MDTDFEISLVLLFCLFVCVFVFIAVIINVLHLILQGRRKDKLVLEGITFI